MADNEIYDEANPEGFEADIGASGFNDALAARGRQSRGTPTGDYLEDLATQGTASTPVQSHFTSQERAAMVAAAMKGDTSGLLTRMPEGQKRAKKGQYNPSRYVESRRVQPVRISTENVTDQATGERVTRNKNIFAADIEGRGTPGFAPVTSNVAAAIAAARSEPRGFNVPFSAEDPAILRPGRGGALQAHHERHNIIANAIQDRNARLMREHLERERPASQPRVVSRGIRTGSERFERTDTGQEVVSRSNPIPADTGQREAAEESRARTGALGDILAIRYGQRLTGPTTTTGAKGSRVTEGPMESIPVGPPAPQREPAPRFTPEQESNMAAQRDILARQGAAQQAAQARRAAGQARRDARMAEAVEARRTADAPPEMDLPDESQLPTPTLGGRPREQRAALIEASAAMRGRMPLVSTADPEQVNRGARAAAQRYTETSRMFEAEPRRLEGGGRGPRSFIDPEAAAGRRGDLRHAQASDFAFGEDPEQIDVDMSNQILGAWRRQSETEGILAREMQTDSTGSRLQAPSTPARIDSSKSTEREVRAMVRESSDPYMTGAEAFGRMPVVGQQFERGEPGVVNEVLRSGEGAISRSTAVAAQERRAARLSAERERAESRSRTQRMEELARRERERGEAAPGPARPAREQGPNTISTPGPDDASRIAKEIADRAMAGEDLNALRREYGIG